MKSARFQGTLLDGHTGAAVEVPFNPTARWSIPARQLRRGRRGHHVRGTLNGTIFDSAVVPRSRKFYLLIDESLMQSAGVDVGETVDVVLEPLIIETGV
jgi:hypothetical protein